MKTTNYPGLHLASRQPYISLFLLVACLVMFMRTSTAQCTEWESPSALFEPAALSASEIPTHTSSSSVGLNLLASAFLKTRGENLEKWTLILPVPGHPKASLELQRFSPFSPDLLLGETRASGMVESPYSPQLQTFRVVAIHENGRRFPEAGGIVSLMTDHVVGSVRWNGDVFEIAPVGPDGLHATYLLADSRLQSNFSCEAESLEFNQIRRQHRAPHPGTRTVSNPVVQCVEVALDIDQYTYNTFGGVCNSTVEWALALLAGVSEIYVEELSDLINLQASYVHVWETTDPYASYVQNAGSMLDAFRSEWVTNPDLSGIDRDLVHLLTRRTNTGTGGIAYLDVVCSNQFAVGFSSYLSGTSTYNGGYSWNLNVVAHELGHNFGSNHTQWCGWPGGPIDNCGSLEGSCAGYVNNPTAQVGTIMSYCHAISGGSVNLIFHPTVKAWALTPTINSDGYCYNICDTYATNCAVFGCMDPEFCNYNAEAQFDDGSCTVLDACGECGGDGTSCFGCTDAMACNYDPSVTSDDGSCFFAPGGGGCDCEAELTWDVTLSGGESTSTTVAGVGTLAAMYATVMFTNLSSNPDAKLSDLRIELTGPDGVCQTVGGFDVPSSCDVAGVWPPTWSTSISGTYASSVIIANDVTGQGNWTISLTNGWSASPEVQYTLALSFFNLCLSTPPPGCTDPAACNYNAASTEDDGSCEYGTCDGCTDESACNFDFQANVDDGTCDYETCAGCTEPGACNFDFLATIDDGSCQYTTCAGCTDLQACNYNPAATIGDNSCEYSSCSGCTTSYACNFDPNALLDDGTCDFNSCAGCDDPNACNFDPNVTLYDGSCEYSSCEGCMDATACNYQPWATIDSGECTYGECGGCPGDLNGDNLISIADVLVLLGDFGCETPPCAGDTNNDGVTNINDLLVLLSGFGVPCP